MERLIEEESCSLTPNIDITEQTSKNCQTSLQTMLRSVTFTSNSLHYIYMYTGMLWETQTDRQTDRQTHSSPRIHSATSTMCVVRRTYSNYGDRCFAAAGLKLWNSLSAELRQADINFQWFKWLINTFFFRGWDRTDQLLKLCLKSFLTYLCSEKDKIKIQLLKHRPRVC